MDDNTKAIIAWGQRMMTATGLCGAALWEVLAWYADEEGNDSPSDDALAVARRWEQSPQELYDIIVESGRWCLSPTVGCRAHCEKWQEEWVGS